MSWLDNLGSGFPGMEFPHGETVKRERRQATPDPYNPDRVTLGPWSEATSITLESCFIDSTSSSSTNDANREPVSTSKSLYSTDPGIDVKVGDRIRRGSDIFYIRERTEADTNPFTGWQPVVEIPLSMEEG